MRAENTFQSQSRADQLRQRRAQQSREHTATPRRTAARPSAPPVTVRSYQSSMATPLRQTRTSTVRKQTYYSLGSSGAELRLPALPFAGLGSRTISAILVGLMALALYVVAFSEEFQINSSKLMVSGIQRLTTSDIDAALAIDGEQVINLNPEELTAKLATAYPELTSIDLKIGFPASVIIDVVERQPVLAWKTGDVTYWIDQNGFILPPRGEVEGLQTIDADTLPDLLPVSSVAAAETNTDQTAAPTSTSYWGRQINNNLLKSVIDLPGRISIESNLVYNSLNGLGWKDPRGWSVFIGRELTNIDQKLAIYDSLIKDLDQRGITPTEMVSVEFINAPFYK
jgi:hypothetical protein